MTDLLAMQAHVRKMKAFLDGSLSNLEDARTEADMVGRFIPENVAKEMHTAREHIQAAKFAMANWEAKHK